MPNRPTQLKQNQNHQSRGQSSPRQTQLSRQQAIKNNKKINRKKRRMRIIRNFLILGVLIFVVLGGIFGGATLYFLENAKPKSIMIMGSDERESLSSSRSDALMYATINPKKGKILLTSIPRDSYVPVPCSPENADGYDKITHAFAYGNAQNPDGGGIQCVMDSVNATFDDNVSEYVEVNFTGLISIIDEIGGITLTPTATFCEMNSKGKKNAYCFEEGKEVLMDGEMALSYSRHRKSDSDIYRTKRQQEVLFGIFDQIKHTKVSKYPKIYRNIMHNINTNLSSFEILELGTTALHDMKIEKYELEGYDYWGKRYYYKLYDSSIDGLIEKTQEYKQ